MELTSEISLSAIGELNQKEHKKKNNRILSAAFIGASIFVLGFLAFAQATMATCKSAQKESYCECGDKCSCGTSCCCYLNDLK